MPKYSITSILIAHPKLQIKVTYALILLRASSRNTDVPDLGIIMSKDCSFDSHISSLPRKCNNLAGWILRSFVSRDRLTIAPNRILCIMITNLNRKQNNNYGSKTVLIILAVKASDQ